ncbi:hypothetical protein B6I21_04265 [candidate division KSB1 bacterium 4572_119]|nr:MAG: hypothetical protein B6I21_04265 [candidate division KSB1 bacterium 4572_119]
MKNENVLQAFENLVEKLSIDLRYEKGDFSGGLCRMPEKNILIINSRLPEEQKVRLIAAELSMMELNHIYIRPALREIMFETEQTNTKIL